MIKHLYYRMTGHLPRRMPRTKEEIEWMKEILVTQFGVEDSPQSWLTVFGHMAAIPAHCVTMRLTRLANAAHRLKINELAQTVRMESNQALQNRLQNALDEMKGADSEQVPEVIQEANAGQEQGKAEVSAQEAPQQSISGPH